MEMGPIRREVGVGFPLEPQGIVLGQGLHGEAKVQDRVINGYEGGGGGGSIRQFKKKGKITETKPHISARVAHTILTK